MAPTVLTVDIWLVEKHEVTMAPAFRHVGFLNFELFLFMLKNWQFHILMKE